MSLKITPKKELSDFEKQYLSDRLIDWNKFLVNADEEPADESEGEDEGEGEDEPYTEWTNDELRAEIQTRNESRGEDVQLSSDGKKSELIARLEADDAEGNADNDA